MGNRNSVARRKKLYMYKGRRLAVPRSAFHYRAKRSSGLRSPADDSAAPVIGDTDGDCTRPATDPRVPSTSDAQSGSYLVQDTSQQHNSISPQDVDVESGTDEASTGSVGPQNSSEPTYQQNDQEEEPYIEGQNSEEENGSAESDEQEDFFRAPSSSWALYLKVGLLKLLVSKTRDLYGTSSMTYNMHQLLHLIKSAEFLRPLWAHSAFVFEGGNGALVKTVTAAKGAPLQVIERVAMAQELDMVLCSTSLSHTVRQLCHDMLGYQPLRSFNYIGGACKLGTPTLVYAFSRAEGAALQQACGYVPSSATEFFRFILNGQVYHSAPYTRAKKTDSSVTKSKGGCLLSRIQRVLKVTVDGTEKCVLLCKEIILSEAPSATSPCHINEATVSPIATFKVVELHQVICPSLFINFPAEENSYVCELLNIIERD